MADLSNSKSTENTTLYDDNGNLIGVVLKGVIYRLEGRNVLTNQDGTKDVSVVTDGSTERLAVDINQTGGVVLEKFFPHFEFEADTPVVLSDTVDTTLFSVSEVGKLDFISITGNRSDYEVAIEIDAIEVLRINMGQLGDDLALNTSSSEVLPIYVTNANKGFRMMFSNGADFSTSFSIKVKKTIAGAVDVTWLIKWRDQS